MNQKGIYLSVLKLKLESYVSIANESWQSIETLATFQNLNKGDILLRQGQLAKQFHFIVKGAIRAYTIDDKGDNYNKNLFFDTDFAGSMVSLILNKPSNFSLEALEDSILISLNYKSLRKLIFENNNLKEFYIAYLEKNWVIDKEQREVSLVMDNAKERYLELREQHPKIDERIPQIHIAGHLGITPTQLSRIRKSLK